MRMRIEKIRNSEGRVMSQVEEIRKKMEADLVHIQNNIKLMQDRIAISQQRLEQFQQQRVQLEQKLTR